MGRGRCVRLGGMGMDGTMGALGRTYGSIAQHKGQTLAGEGEQRRKGADLDDEGDGAAAELEDAIVGRDARARHRDTMSFRAWVPGYQGPEDMPGRDQTMEQCVSSGTRVCFRPTWTENQGK